MRKRTGKKSLRKRKPVATKLPPEAPAARDEGPRLIPLGKVVEPPKLNHWMDLAEKALGAAAGEPSRKRPGKK